MGSHNDIVELVIKLTERLGRMPTEDEVSTFILGTEEDRKRIWNLGAQ